MRGVVFCLWIVALSMMALQTHSQEIQHRTKLGEFARDFLTEEEIKWLIDNPVIRYSADPDWPPFSFGDIEGRLWGIESDLLATIHEKTGLKFQYVPHQNWIDIYDSLKKRKIHFVPSVARTPSREENLIFTEKYWNFPVVIITRKDEPFHKSVESLASMRLVLPKGHVSGEHIHSRHSHLKFIELGTTAQCIEAVARHKADATVENLAAAAYIIRNMRYNNLKVSGLMGYDFAGHYALHRDETVLRSILQKALNQIAEQDKEAIFNKWITGDVEGSHLWYASLQTAKRWGYFLGAVLLVSIFWIVLLLLQIRARKKTQQLLETANAKLRESNEQKNRNMGIIAHDLRAPLTHLNLALELLKNQVPNMPDSATQSVNEMFSTVSYMDSSINNLLDRHRIEQDSVDLKIKPVDLLSMIDQSLRRLTPASLAKSISVQTNLSPQNSQKIMVAADAHALRHVLDNLLSNAIKYSPQKSTITVRLFKEKDKGLFSVIDEGPGVSAEDELRLFQAFARLSAQPTGGESSTGLGLSIVKYFVEKMDGKVTYQKGPGGLGACFTVALPLANERDGDLKK